MEVHGPHCPYNPYHATPSRSPITSAALQQHLHPFLSQISCKMMHASLEPPLKERRHNNRQQTSPARLPVCPSRASLMSAVLLGIISIVQGPEAACSIMMPTVFTHHNQYEDLLLPPATLPKTPPALHGTEGLTFAFPCMFGTPDNVLCKPQSQQ